MLCDITLPFLWSISIHMKISLGVIWFKEAFCVYTVPLKTPYDLTKTKNVLLHI